MYLLSTQSLIDVMRGAETPVGAWYDSLEIGLRRFVFASVLSFGRIASQIHSLPAENQGNWTRMLARTRHGLLQGNRILGIDLDIVDLWSELLIAGMTQRERDGSETPLPDDERLVVASAIRHRYTLIDRPHPFHDAMARLHGLMVLTPGNMPDAESGC